MTVSGRVVISLVVMTAAASLLRTADVFVEGRYLPTRSDNQRLEYIKEVLRQILDMDSPDDDVRSPVKFPYEEMFREGSRQRALAYDPVSNSKDMGR